MNPILLLLEIVIAIIAFIVFGVFAIFVIVFTLLVLALIYAYVMIWFHNIKLRKLLSSQSRTLSLEEAKIKIKAGDGMILVDNPTVGWNTNRIWWAPQSEFFIDADTKLWDGRSTKSDIANYQKFINPERGIAKLVDSFVLTQRTHRYLLKHFGLTTCGFVPTGLIELNRMREKHEPNNRNDDLHPQ